MSIKSTALTRLGYILGYILVALGVLAGVLSSVKLGAIAISCGTVGVSFGRTSASRVERIMPIALALALLAMAIALPR